MSEYRATYEFKGWKYVHEQKKELKESISIIPSEKKPIPISLYKYYSLTPYNLDALYKNYLYASHPFELMTNLTVIGD